MNKLICASMFSAMAISVSAYAQTSPVNIVSNSDIKWTEGRVKGVAAAPIVGSQNESGFYIQRTRFTPGFVVPAHTHPAAEYVTVISGTFYVGQGETVDETKATPVGPGGVIVVQPNVPHFALVKEETVIQQQGIGPTAINFLK